MLIEKIKNNQPGILLYGLTPPKISEDEQKVIEVAKRRLARLENSGIDGLVIYDLQDESNRTDEIRTYEFVKNISPEIYHEKYLHKAYPSVIYKAVGNYSLEEFTSFCENAPKDSLSVFVGASSKKDSLRLDLNTAYKIKKECGSNITTGGICIPERHEKKGDEDARIASKTLKGCEFFITQAIYNLENAKKLIDDYANLDIKKVPLIFTFTPCGSKKTLDFMKWLSISVPEYFEKRLLNDENILASSTKLSCDLFEFLFHYGKAKGISVGANVESVSVKKEEVLASIELLANIKSIIDNEKNFTYKNILCSASKNIE